MHLLRCSRYSILVGQFQIFAWVTQCFQTFSVIHVFLIFIRGFFNLSLQIQFPHLKSFLSFILGPTAHLVHLKFLGSILHSFWLLILRVLRNVWLDKELSRSVALQSIRIENICVRRTSLAFLYVVILLLILDIFRCLGWRTDSCSLCQGFFFGLMDRNLVAQFVVSLFWLLLWGMATMLAIRCVCSLGSRTLLFQAVVLLAATGLKGDPRCRPRVLLLHFLLVNNVLSSHASVNV